MTREEIIEAYEGAVFSSGLSAAAGNEDAARDYELLKAGLDALRFPTREMVERMRRGCSRCTMPEHVALDAGAAHEFRISNDTIYYCDSEYGWEGEKISYCPWCGKPLTDEAVDMMLRRWKEALYEL